MTKILRKHFVRFPSVREPFVVLLLVFFASSCTTTSNFSQAPLSRYDKNTQFSIEYSDGEFGLSVLYTRYQFIPESDALLAACKQALTSLAYNIAERRDREIEPINEQRIRISIGRNGLTGVTSCSASVPVKYA